MLLNIYPLIPTSMNIFASFMSLAVVYPSIALMMKKCYHPKAYILFIPISNFFFFIVPIIIASIKNAAENYYGSIIFLIIFCSTAAIMAIIIILLYKRRTEQEHEHGEENI